MPAAGEADARGQTEHGTRLTLKTSAFFLSGRGGPRGIFWPLVLASLSSSPRARTTLLTPTAIICRRVISLLRSTLSSNTCASTDDTGAGVPFGCIVTADNWISTGSSSSESSSPASFRSALRSVRSVWLTDHLATARDFLAKLGATVCHRGEAAAARSRGHAQAASPAHLARSRVERRRASTVLRIGG